MKKQSRIQFVLLFTGIILILATTFTKNSTKKIDKNIFNLKEDIRILKDKYEYVLLDYNFLSSPKRLLEYQKTYFENELIPIDIQNMNQIEFNDKKILIKKLIQNSND